LALILNDPRVQPMLRSRREVAGARTDPSSVSGYSPKWRIRRAACGPEASGSHAIPAVITRSRAPGIRSSPAVSSWNRARANEASSSTRSWGRGRQKFAQVRPMRPLASLGSVVPASPTKSSSLSSSTPQTASVVCQPAAGMARNPTSAPRDRASGSTGSTASPVAGSTDWTVPRPSRRDLEEAHALRLLLRVAQRPLALEQQERRAPGIADQRAAVAPGKVADLRIVALDPARRAIRQPRELRNHTVLVLQPVQQHIELELPHGADDRRHTGRRILVEHLHRAFLRELTESRVQMLASHGVRNGDAREVLGAEARDAAERDVAVRGQRVADAEAAAVMDADHVAGPRLLHGHTLLGQELLRLREPYVLSAARVAHDHTRLEPARTDADERDAVPVLRVHVRLDLEHEAGERCVVRPDDAVPGLAGWRRGREFEEVLEERLDAEVGERA